MTTLADLIAASSKLQTCPAWQALTTHQHSITNLHLRTLLDEPNRYKACSRQACGLTLDFSRNLLTTETLELLLQLADERQLGVWIEQLFDGAPVNNTEDRPALHMALRRSTDRPLVVADKDVMTLVHGEREKFLTFADSIRDGTHLGATGQSITDVVNIGIGGSDLGLVMLDAALAEYRDPALRTHFVSNIDGTQLADVLDQVTPESTLFIICSKSFTTIETQLNADAARRWFLASMPVEAIGRHFAAVSVNSEAMDRFGIGNELRFAIWDWVGGRYSLWSAVGLVVAIGIGAENFRELLAGAASMDDHFETTPFVDNLPVLLGLLGIWQRNFLGAASHAVLPYDQRLRYFPAFLQQLEMESNGKSVTRDGQPVDTETGTVVWGEPGSNAQHSFFQLLHQGTANVSLDFIAPVAASSGFTEQHLHGLGNMLAQAEAFAHGYTAEAVAADLSAAGCSETEVERLVPHKTHPGNRSSSVLLMDRLEPRRIGALIALYEHKVFVQSVIWGINPFDQWGVELGKTMAGVMSAGLIAADDDPELPPIAGIIRAQRATKP
jgi:glucose-6-phosphate isomerase